MIPPDNSILGLQRRIDQWGTRCFGAEQMQDSKIRGLRLIEEAVEFGQAVGIPKEKILTLLDHVYSRPAGDPFQEMGGVAVTALAAATSLGRCFIEPLLTEVERVESKSTEHFRERNQQKLDLLGDQDER